MKEPIMSKASTNSAECIYPWEASGAPLAEDATLLGPLFTRPLRGAKAIREFYETSGEVAGPLKVRLHMNKHVETFLIGSQLVGEHNVHSALWLKRDGAGRVREISHAMRPFPLLLPYHRAMKERLAELIPQKRWTIDQSDAFIGASRASAKASQRASELFNPGAGAILVFLCGPTANAAGTDQDTLAEDRDGALAIEHVVAFGRGDAAQGRMVGTWRQITTRASEGSRGHGLALAAEGARPHGAIHALKGKEPSAGVAHGDIHLGTDLVGLLDCAGYHAIGIRKGEGHEVNPFRSATHQGAGASRRETWSRKYYTSETRRARSRSAGFGGPSGVAATGIGTAGARAAKWCTP